MGITDQLGGANVIFKSSISSLSQYKWIFIVLIILTFLIGVIYVYRMFKKKKNQWTHKFIVKRVLQNGKVTAPIIHLARRFPKQQGAEIFELEKPILGSYLISQPGSYVDINTFSIILDKNNRIWSEKETKFNPSSQSLEISAVHSGIDVTMKTMKDRWQEAHQTDKKLTTAELIKAGLKALGIVAIVILGIIAIQHWGDAQTDMANKAESEAQAMSSIHDAVLVMKDTVNTQQLQITPMLKALYGSNSIAKNVKKYCGNSTGSVE